MIRSSGTVLRADSAFVYVDANYVAQELRDAGLNPEYNPAFLWRKLDCSTADGHSIRPERYFFYDATDENAEKDIQDAKHKYLLQVEALAYCAVRTGFVKGPKKRRQKGIDVQIAVDALEA